MRYARCGEPQRSCTVSTRATGEPDDAKVSCPVRKGAGRKGGDIRPRLRPTLPRFRQQVNANTILGVCLRRSPSHSDLLSEATYIVEEDAPPMCRRIRLGRATVKELHSRCGMPFSAMMCDWYGASQCCTTCWCTRCPWRCSVTNGASVSCLYHWRRAFCCGAWTTWSIAIAGDDKN